MPQVFASAALETGPDIRKNKHRAPSSLRAFYSALVFHHVFDTAGEFMGNLQKEWKIWKVDA